MIIGIGENSTFRYVSDLDKTEPKTVFVCRTLKARFKEQIAQQSAAAPDKQIKISVVDVALAGIVEIISGDKTETVIDETVLDTIPFVILTEISKVIIEKSFLSEGEAKN